MAKMEYKDAVWWSPAISCGICLVSHARCCVARAHVILTCGRITHTLILHRVPKKQAIVLSIITLQNC